MELDFDKEIDAILRNARRDSPATPASRHLDADEISAFAENAVPEKSRSLYAAHMADCDRCRKILSGLLVLNSEVLPIVAAEPASAITIAERAVPWYRSLFMFPNLAYVMGGLVLVFGGFLAFSVIQNSRDPLTAAVAPNEQASAPAAEGGPRFDQGELESSLNSNSNASANAAANVAVTEASRMSNASSVASNMTGTSPGGPRSPENNFVMDGVSTTDSTVRQPVAAAPPPAASVSGAAAEPAAPMKTLPAPRDDAATLSKLENKEIQQNSQEASKKDAISRQQQSGLPIQSGPMNNDRGYNRQLENMDRANAKQKAARAAAADEDASGGRKVVSGRTFERKQGVWYDTKYQGHPTINVRRGSDEFKKLDGGLRGIANSLSGTIVVVWGAKAYRIQ